MASWLCSPVKDEYSFLICLNAPNPMPLGHLKHNQHKARSAHKPILHIWDNVGDLSLGSDCHNLRILASHLQVHHQISRHTQKHDHLPLAEQRLVQAEQQLVQVEQRLVQVEQRLVQVEQLLA